jgi:asparagine synthase (glutamine-hydrolysing)
MQLSQPLAVLTVMTDALSHRGPDDSGYWIDDADCGVALGHRRLSIIDLSQAGHQPMTSASGRYIIIYNGEIYNHVQMRRTLEAAGCGLNWRGHSDTETLLAAIEAWGIERAFAESTGMFAAAIWDRKTRTLTLARDRIGEKPLYYGWWNGAFLFASELKAFKQFPAFAPQIDVDALGLYLAFGYVPGPRAIYRGFYKLPPGSLLTLRAENGPAQTPTDVEIVRYWSLNNAMNAPLFTGTLDEATYELERRLSSAISLQKLADVPLGCFLSGGIDSSTVAALMQAQSSRPIRTFAIGFREAAFNEAKHAADVARHLGTDHTELIVTANDALELVPRLPHVWDEPFSDSSQIPTTLVAALAREKVTVCLSGDGGDELFGGYNHYKLSQSLEQVPAKALAAAALRYTPLNAIARLCEAAPIGRFHEITERRLRSVEQVLSGKSRFDRYMMLMAQWKTPSDLVEGTCITPNQATDFRPPPGTEDLNIISSIDVMTYLPDDILVKVDRAAMAVSLETRVPLLDHRVVEFAFSLPAGMKGYDRKVKAPLRKVLAKYVPTELTDRPKQGFGVPICEWLRGPLREWAQSLITPAALENSGLKRKSVAHLWAQFQAGVPHLENRLWTILMYQAWHTQSS